MLKASRMVFAPGLMYLESSKSTLWSLIVPTSIGSTPTYTHILPKFLLKKNYLVVMV